MMTPEPASQPADITAFLTDLARGAKGAQTWPASCLRRLR
jgi:hypothetical protein